MQYIFKRLPERIFVTYTFALKIDHLSILKEDMQRYWHRALISYQKIATWSIFKVVLSNV